MKKKKRFSKVSYSDLILCCSSDDALKEVEKYNGQIIYKSNIFPFIGVRIRTDCVNKLKQCKGIDSVHIDKKINFIPKDRKLKANAEIVPWNIRRVFATRSRINTGRNVRVAVFDTGVDLNHPDLRNNIAGGVNLINPGESFQDDEGHGTFVAGIIAAVNNSIDMIGIAPRADIYAVKVLDNTGFGTFTAIIQGIEWAIENRMQVINMSLGTASDFLPFRQAIAEAIDRGILIVAAVGNSGNLSGTGDTVDYPAKYPYVIGVAALTEENRRATFSSTGRHVDISAPGENVISLSLDGGLAMGSGTSFSAPHVTGVLAIYKRARPRATSLQLRRLLFSRARQLSSVNKSRLTGYGLVQQ